MSKYDVVVIGAGLAGLSTACQLTQANKKVLLVAHGSGALLLSSGCVDLLGFQPVSSQEPVKNPLEKMDAFLAECPDHPYKLIGKENIEAGLDAFLQLANQDSVKYQGTANQNWLLPSTIGAVHATCLAPTSLVNGELSEGGKMLIVGFKELRDFYPALISQNINEQNLGVQSDHLIIDLPPISFADKWNVTPIELGHAFEKADFRRQVINAVKDKAKAYDRIGFPAVLGIDQHADVMADLEKQLGKTVFEITTLPPSVPGRRLYDHLRRVFSRAGGRIIIGSKVVGGTIENGRVTEIRYETANRVRSATANHYVLATGGIFGGGLETDNEGKVWETVFDLPVPSESDRALWYTPNFLSPQGQPVGLYGVHVNQQLKPVNGSNTPAVENLYLAGAIIAGSNWIRGRTGNGLALATAATVVKQISHS